MLSSPVPSQSAADVDATAAQGRCTNCGAPFVPERRRFCPECGQETHIKPPKLSEFLQQFGGAYLSTEGALWRTLALLLAKPGELTRRYLNGQRKHYVLPLRLYLSISLITLLVLRVMASGNEEAFKFDLSESDTNFAVVSLGEKHKVGMRDGAFFCQGFPPWFCKRLQRRLDLDNRGLRLQAMELSERAISNIGVGMFFMLPIFALSLKIVYWGRRMRYTEHLVFALHVHAFWFLALALLFANLPWLSVIAGAAVPIYTLMAMKRVYGGRWWPRWLRAALVSLGYGIVLSFGVAGVVILTFLS
jgi:Protein of unknown function (DUF3667)